MMTPLLVFAAGLVGGSIAWVRAWSDRRLHAALSLSTGAFLGAVFLHLLPDVARRAATRTEVDAIWLWAAVLAGVLLVHLIEAVFLRTMEQKDQRRHERVGWVTLVGVSVHAASAGLGLAALQRDGAVAGALLSAFLLHKAFESFALANVLLLAHRSRRQVASLVSVFALVTPLFLLAGDRLLDATGPGTLDTLAALATGTFLYVCVAELLPEVFHHRGDNLVKTLGLALGVGLAALTEL